MERGRRHDKRGPVSPYRRSPMLGTSSWSGFMAQPLPLVGQRSWFMGRISGRTRERSQRSHMVTFVAFRPCAVLTLESVMPVTALIQDYVHRAVGPYRWRPDA
jgi:hypothetical protein